MEQCGVGPDGIERAVHGVRASQVSEECVCGHLRKGHEYVTWLNTEVCLNWDCPCESYREVA